MSLPTINKKKRWKDKLRKKKKYLHNEVAAFVAFATDNEGCDIAAKVTKFCTDIGAKRPFDESDWALSPVVSQRSRKNKKKNTTPVSIRYKKILFKDRFFFRN